MKKIVLYLCFMLIMVLPLLGVAYEQTEEYAEKQAILNEKADNFKADTGFRGEINYGYDPIKLGSFYGKFADIQFSAGADTTAFRQVCNLILDKIMPYSFANRSQLSMVSITEEIEFFKTEYYQVVNGYQVDIGGFIGIMYDFGSKRFFVGNNTVELPEETKLHIITPTEAEQIALRDKNIEHYSRSKVYNLFYSSEGSDTYYLAYLVVVSSARHESDDSYAYWIDAFTGKIKKSCVNPVYKSDIEVTD